MRIESRPLLAPGFHEFSSAEIAVDLLVVWNPAWQAMLDVEALERFHQMLVNSRSRKRYQCDVYNAETTDIAMMAYWRGWFGFMRDGRTPKGIGVVLI